MSDGKLKIYKNPDRNKGDNFKPYTPQYQVHGVEPSEYRSAVVPSGSPTAAPSTVNPRDKRAPMRQPYAPTATSSPVGRGRGPIPNVGNNMEQSWSSVDGGIIDDMTNEPPETDQQMIDNNHFMTDQALGFRAGQMASELQHVPQGRVTLEEMPPVEYQQMTSDNHSSDADDVLPILADLADDAYLLIVTGVPVCSGPKEEIEEQSRLLVFGEHEMCDGQPIPIDDILIVKRVKIKVGLFLE
jgi:hypothetical protein